MKKMSLEDLEKFLPTSATVPNLLDELYKEVPIFAENTYEDFINLPVIAGYKSNAIKEVEKIAEIVTLDIVEDLTTGNEKKISIDVVNEVLKDSTNFISNINTSTNVSVGQNKTKNT